MCPFKGNKRQFNCCLFVYARDRLGIWMSNKSKNRKQREGVRERERERARERKRES